MNKKLRNAVKKAEDKLNEANCAVQSIEPHLVFCGFDKILPQVSACNGDEIIIEYFGSEMSIKEAVERMEDYGYITPDCFE